MRGAGRIRTPNRDRGGISVRAKIPQWDRSTTSAGETRSWVEPRLVAPRARECRSGAVDPNKEGVRSADLDAELVRRGPGERSDCDGRGTIHIVVRNKGSFLKEKAAG